MEKSRGLWLFSGIFLGLIVVGMGVYVLESRIQKAVVSSSATSIEYNGPAEYHEYQKWIDAYEAEMRADTVGGKTPEETLRLFIDALRKGDAELAAKYTLLDVNDPDVRTKYRADIEKKKSEGKLNEIADTLSKAVYDASSSGGDTAWFSVWNEEGMVDYSALLKFNKYSGVWKIESM